MADPSGHDVGRLGIRLTRVGPGKEPDHVAARLPRPARGRLHHPSAAAAHDDRSRLGEAPPDLLGQGGKLRVGGALPDHGYLQAFGHALPIAWRLLARACSS
jgi:hypothetical protein